MADLITGMLAMIFGGVATGNVEGLTVSVASYNSAAWSFAQQVNQAAVKPVAASILSIILVLEFVRISSRYDGDSRTGTQQIAMVILKCVLVVIAVQNANLILGAIQEVGSQIMAGLGKPPQNLAGVNFDPQKIKTAVGSLPGLDQFAFLLSLLLPWLASLAANVIVIVMVVMRFAEIYIMSAFAPLPIVFLGNDETKAIGVGYLKKYAAVVLQGVVILLVCIMYKFVAPSLFKASALVAALTSSQKTGVAGALAGVGDALSSASGYLGPAGWVASKIISGLTGTNGADPGLVRDVILSNYVGLVGAPIMLVVMLVASGRIARALLGE